jgi:hypothetical protein
MAAAIGKDDLEAGKRSVQDNLTLLHRYFDLLYTKNLSWPASRSGVETPLRRRR